MGNCDTMETVSFVKVLPLCQLPKESLVLLAQTCSAVRRIVLPHLLGTEESVFERGSESDSLSSFCKLLREIQVQGLAKRGPCPPIGHFLKKLRLENLDPGLYDAALGQDWLTIVSLSCPNLESLQVLNCSALVSDQTLLYSHSPFPRLSRLSFIGLRNVRAKTLGQWITSPLKNLCLLSLQDCGPALNDALLETLVSSPLSLQSLTLRKPGSSLTSIGLASFFNSACYGISWDRLESLDLSDCPLVGDEALLSISLKTRLLKSVSLIRCTRVTLTGIQSLVSPVLQSLDLSHCRSLNVTVDALRTLFSHLPGLVFLGLSYSVIDRLREEKPLVLDAFSQLVSLKSLLFTDIQENTPGNIIKTLARGTLRNLLLVILSRDRYTRDDVLGMYAPIQESHLIINDDFVNLYNKERTKGHAKMLLEFTDSRNGNDPLWP